MFFLLLFSTDYRLLATDFHLCHHQLTFFARIPRFVTVNLLSPQQARAWYRFIYATFGQ